MLINIAILLCILRGFKKVLVLRIAMSNGNCIPIKIDLRKVNTKMFLISNK